MITFRFLRNSSIEKYTPFIILGMIMVIFVGLQYNQLDMLYLTPYDEGFIKPKLDKCNLNEIIQYRAPVKLLILCSSNEIFHNPRTIEFMLVILTFPLIYGITKEITKNRYVGLVSCGILLFDRIFSLQSFTIYGSSEWVFFFLMAVYSAYKLPYFTGLFLFLSISFKGLWFLFFPFQHILKWKAVISKKYKKINVISILIIVVTIIIVTFFIGEQLLQKISLNINVAKLDQALLTMIYIFRDDPNYLIVIFPASVIGLILTSRHNPVSRILLAMILTFYFLVFALPLLSDYSMFDYRMILMMFFDKNEFTYMSKIGMPVILEKTWKFDPLKDNVLMEKISDNCNAIIVYNSNIVQFKGLVGCNPNASEPEIEKTKDSIKTILSQLENQIQE